MKVDDKTVDDHTIRKIQLSQHYILDAYNAFCTSHDLPYMIDFGTMLGAVRHQGFIPWDDDIDVSMLRDDYDKFLELGKQWDNHNIFIQNYHTDPEFIHSFTRLRLNDTLAVQSDWQNLKVHHGIFIDVFPYDVIAGDEAQSQIHADAIKAIQTEKMSYVLSNSVNAENLKALNIKQTKLIGSYNNTQTGNMKVAHMTQGLDSYYDSRRYPQSFVDTIQLPFEKGLFSVPKDYDTILKNLYQNYMDYPDVSEQKPHHGVIQLKFRDDIIAKFDN